MSSQDRIDAITTLEKEYGCSVITYITGDRNPTQKAMSDEDVRVLYEHLVGIGRGAKRIGLFIYSRGGDLLVPARIVHLVREYSEALDVLVPYRAHSAATLLCIGADSIVMGEMAELTSVDPTTANPFNPQAVQGDPRDLANKIPISVEDVEAYFSLASDRAKLVSEREKIEIFKALTNTVQPMALGNIHRISRDIRNLAPRLLSFQLKQPDEKGKIPNITKALTETFVHRYPISRKIAEEIGLKVAYPEQKLEEAMWGLYQLYEKDLQLNSIFDPETILGTHPSAKITSNIGFIESSKRGDAYGLEISVTRPQVPAQTMSIGIPSAPTAQPPRIPTTEEYRVRLKPKGWNKIY